MKVVKIPVADLHLDPANLRLHPVKNVAAIKASLTRFGQQTPIVVDGYNVVRKGNGTVVAARELGLMTLYAVRTLLQGSEITGYAIADNRSAELAGWDDAALAATLRAFQAEEFALGDVGFTDAELDVMLEGLAAPIPADGWADAMGGLPTGGKSPFQSMTFTLADMQAETVKDALQRAKDAGTFVDTGNENSNGNALERICASYVDQR